MPELNGQTDFPLLYPAGSLSSAGAHVAVLLWAPGRARAAAGGAGALPAGTARQSHKPIFQQLHQHLFSRHIRAHLIREQASEVDAGF